MKSGEPLRVLYVIADHTRMAGANRSVLELIRNLPPRVVPYVVVTAAGKVAEAFRSQGIAAEVIEPGPAMNTFGGWLVDTSLPTRVGIGIRELIPFSVRLHGVIRRHRIDVVHVNDGRGAVLAAVAARLARVPIVGHVHGELLFSGLGRWVIENIPRRLAAVSDGVRRTLSAKARRKAVTVYNGMTTAPFSTTPIPFLDSLRARGVTIVSCFASLTPFKGCHHLIEALALLNARGWRQRLAVLWIGDVIPVHQDYQDWLLRKIGEHRIDNFTFTGWHDSPFSFYRSADATVLPSVSEEILRFDGRAHRVLGSEGFPLTNLEAMSFALPVVATRISGVPEQVEHGTTGLLVAPGDATALADALERLVSDPAAAAAMGEAGLRRVQERFSTGEFVAGLVRVYEEAARPEKRVAAEGMVARVFGRPGARIRSSSHWQQATFTAIVKANAWGDAESVSGPGSTQARGADFQKDLIALFDGWNVRSILDAPCGDFNWMRHALAHRDLSYMGVDIVEELVSRNVNLHATGNRRFLCADMTRADLPQADLIICRDALVHLSFVDARAAIRNFRRSGSRYLLTTTFESRRRNHDVRTGGWRPLNLEVAPFGFPAPLALIDERCTHTGGMYRDKRLALWDLASLPPD